MKLKQLGTNRIELEFENARILISYETPVAAWIAGEGWYKTEKNWSRTTSKHITQWGNHEGVTLTQTRPQEFFNHLLTINKKGE